MFAVERGSRAIYEVRAEDDYIAVRLYDAVNRPYTRISFADLEAVRLHLVEFRV